MSSREFGHNPAMGIRRVWHTDPLTGDVTVETQQDTESILESARGHRQFFDERTPWKGDVHRVAHIPLSVMLELDRQGIARDQKALRKWLNDPDNAAFRTRPGKV